ncbi:MAG: FG-GAP-like repeat-containing protein [Planctomycetota bacterium]
MNTCSFRRRSVVDLLARFGLGLAVLGLLAGEASSQKVLLAQGGGSAGAALGIVSAAGDIDGDSVPDLAFGTPSHDGERGRVQIMSGASKSVVRTLLGAAAGERFGASVAAAGDVNGDGRDDLIVGAPGGNLVRIHSGLDDSVLRTFTGSGEFGAAVAGLGDLDADGKGDVAVGAPGDNSDTGKVFVYSGNTGTTLGTLAGPAPGARFGSTLGGLPPEVLQGDNEPDLIIGCTLGNDAHQGRVAVHRRSDLSPRLLIDGQTGEQLGLGAHWGGDFNGDGHLDLVLGSAPRDAQGLSTGPGTVRVLSGVDGAALANYTGTSAGELRGFGVGDVNGDGHDDLALGEPLADLGAVDAGRVTVRSGLDGAVLHTVQGASAGSRLGAAGALAGDLNADALMDFAIAAPGDDFGATDAGSICVLSLTVWATVENGLPGVDGVPRLSGQGGVVAGQTGSLTLESARPVTYATLVMGHALTLDSQAGKLTPTPDIITAGLFIGSAGELEYSFEWPTGLVSGLTIYHQFLIQDPDAPGGQSRSNTVAATVP